MAFSYLHVNVIDTMDTTTIIVNIKRGLIKTHVDLIKKGCFLRLENFFMKVKTDYDKGDSNLTIELSIAINVSTIIAFDPPVKLHFLPKDTIPNFSRCMLQPFVVTTIVFIIIGMHGEMITSLSY